MAEIRREIGPQNTCFREAAWTKAWEHRLEKCGEPGCEHLLVVVAMKVARGRQAAG